MAAAPANQAHNRFWAAARSWRLPGALALLLATSGCIEDPDASAQAPGSEGVDGAVAPGDRTDASVGAGDGGADLAIDAAQPIDRGAEDSGEAQLPQPTEQACREGADALMRCASDALHCAEVGPNGRRYVATLDALVSACVEGEGIAPALPFNDADCLVQLERAAAAGVGFDGVCTACPVAAVAQSEVAVAPLTTVLLDGTPTGAVGGAAIRYDWTLVSAPATSNQPVLFERFTNPARPQDGGRLDDRATPTAEFFADVPGDYVFELTVTSAEGPDADGARCPGSAAQTRIAVAPADDFYIQLTWDTPSDDDQLDGEGADLDLHLRHPRGLNWDQSPLDCYYANKTPDWGPAGPDGDPTLDIDDTSGSGPEVIHVESPDDTAILDAPYQVGVHYYRAESLVAGSYGPSTARLQVYFGAVLAFDDEQVLGHTDHFWAPVNIRWIEGEGSVEPVDRLFERMP